jgi:hypothetical protein
MRTKMRTKFLLFIIFILSTNYEGYSQIKIGDNPATIGASSLLELESTDKGIVIPRVANAAAIATPVNGMFIYDNSQSCIVMYKGASWSGCITADKTTTSLTPVFYSSGAFVDAENDVSSADLIELSDGTYQRTGKISWTTHGLTVGKWYYVDATAGNYTSTKPTSNSAQRLFFVEVANTIHIDVEEATAFSYSTNLTTPIIETFYVIANGQISINMTGPAGGGGTATAGGSGANVVAVFNVVEGDVITIVNGEGGFGSGFDGGGGGGSSGIFINNTLITVSGGGAGGDNTAIGLGASSATNGVSGTGGSPGIGGAGGAGGTASTNDPGQTAGGGGGINSAGGSDGAGGGSAADLTPLDGIVLATGGAAEVVAFGGAGGSGLTGGGGGAGNDYPGGGGGYSGGGSGGAGGSAGGGGSYVNTGYTDYVSSTINAGANGAGGSAATDGLDGVLTFSYTPN